MWSCWNHKSLYFTLLYFLLDSDSRKLLIMFLCNVFHFMKSSTKVSVCSPLCKRFRKIFPNVANGNKSGPIPHTPDATFVSPLSFFIFFPTSKTTKLHLLTFTTQGNYCRAARFALRNHRRGPKSVFTTEPDWLLKNVTTRSYRERRKKIKRFPKISVNNSSRIHAPTSIGRP